MDDLLDKACVHTRMRGSKKLTPGDLYVFCRTSPNARPTATHRVTYSSR